MKVLVLGATGFIGNAIVHALSRAGHIVYGQTRSASKAKQLAANEIIPLVGEPTDPNVWQHLIATIDVVIEAVGGSADVSTVGPAIHSAVASIATTSRAPDAPKISYIYTSGTLVHGSSLDEFVSDTTPLSNPAALVAWRPVLEQTILKDERLNGVVIRPGLVYGKNASLFGSAFEKAETTGKTGWFGQPGIRYATIHTDDLADLYVRVAEKAPLLRGIAFDAANEMTESVDEILQKLIQVSGAKGPIEWVKPSNVFEEALATSQLIRPYLAKSLLDWRQKKPSLTEGLPLYYAAWKASRDLE